MNDVRSIANNIVNLDERRKKFHVVWEEQLRREIYEHYMNVDGDFEDYEDNVEYREDCYKKAVDRIVAWCMDNASDMIPNKAFDKWWNR